MTCEKYLKALTIQNSDEYADNSHQLLELAKLCEKYDPYFSADETRRLLEQFDMFDQVGRYGGAAKFDPASRGKTIGGLSVNISSGVQIRGAASWTPKHLDDLDGFVFKTRGLLDFEKIKWGDRIRQILDSQEGHGWKEVLTKDNRYFKA